MIMYVCRCIIYIIIYAYHIDRNIDGFNDLIYAALGSRIVGYVQIVLELLCGCHSIWKHATFDMTHKLVDVFFKHRGSKHSPNSLKHQAPKFDQHTAVIWVGWQLWLYMLVKKLL